MQALSVERAEAQQLSQPPATATPPTTTPSPPQLAQPSLQLVPPLANPQLPSVSLAEAVAMQVVLGRFDDHDVLREFFGVNRLDSWLIEHVRTKVGEQLSKVGEHSLEAPTFHQVLCALQRYKAAQ